MKTRFRSFFWLLLLPLVLAIFLGIGLYRMSSSGGPSPPKAVTASQDRILFFRMGGEKPGLISVNLDGTDESVVFDKQRQIAEHIAPLQVRVSADGKRLLYLTEEPPGPGWQPELNGLWVANVDGSNPKRLAQGTIDFCVRAAAWAGDSDLIAFIKTPASLSVISEGAELWLTKGDGTGMRMLAKDPRLVPEGARLWWTGSKLITWQTSRDILAFDLGSDQIVTLAEGTDSIYAAFSPDGTKVALSERVATDRLKLADVTIVRVPGGAIWDGTGSRVVYNFKRVYSPTESKEGLWLLDVASGKERLLIDVSEEPATAHAMSPDGRFVLYWSPIEGLKLMDIASGRRWVIGAAPPEKAIIWFVDWVRG